MKLKEGDSVPDFIAKDIFDRDIIMSDLRGNKIFLAFFRNVNCPFCNMRVHQLSKKQKELTKAGLKMVFFFESSTQHLQRSIFHKEVSEVPLIGDPEKEVYKRYGIESSIFKTMSTFLHKGAFAKKKEGEKFNVPEDKEKNDDTLIPADFLIDENCKIVKAYYGKNVSDHLDIKEIEKFAGVNNGQSV
ncbi:redoxin domain-containing protein [Marivirga sp.]|uniref:redoxin domain-containing protein n=1 Tax=Marivirga sp. TaxID=2018662 RepID=UPI003DA74C7A